MDVSTLVWTVTVGVTVAVLLFDIVVIGRRPHEPSRREVSVALGIYLSLAVLFGIFVWVSYGHQFGTQFFAGWLTEYSLSIDNLFVFIIIMAKFNVPRQYQQTALMVGIVIALVMRAIFIAVGAAAIERFSWVFYLFGAFLIYTAINLVREALSDEDDDELPKVVTWVQKKLPATEEWHGTSLFARIDGKRLITPMFLVIIALGMTDLLFALDSIPAIYGLTQEPFLVLTANIFALMGLRQLYFLIGGLLKRLVYLSYGLSVLLAFIGVKLIFHALHENELPFLNGGEPFPQPWLEIPTLVSLGAIIGILVVTAVASLAKTGLRGAPDGEGTAPTDDADATPDSTSDSTPGSERR
ncbi:TerC family protein [Nocardioides marmoraquaticus]